MASQSNFEQNRMLHEEKKQFANDLKRRKADYYHAISKITYTALVVGMIVTCAQNLDSIGWQHAVVLLFGVIVTVSTYLFGNNKLK